MDLSLDESIRRSKRNHPHRPKNTRFDRDRQYPGTNNRTRNDDQVFKVRRDRHRQVDRRDPRPRRDERYVGRSQVSTRLRITNLHYDVNESDLLELFSEMASAPGSIQVKLDYDFSGRSNGSATATVSGMTTAIAIQNQFDNVPLDGMPMRIEILPSKHITTSGRMDKSESERSAKDLDAEMDAYMMHK